ncbi:MAG: ATP-binding protein [Bacillota bacterium]
MRRLASLGIQGKITLLAVGLVLSGLLAMGAPVTYLAATSLEHQMGMRALDIARTLAAAPTVQQAFYEPDPIQIIAPLADQVRRSTGAEFVVVLDRAGRLYSHPLPENLGKATAGLDYDPTLMEGRQYYTRLNEGPTLGLAGLSPVYGRDGELMGLVSVGFSLHEVSLLVWRFTERVVWAALAGLSIGSIGALWLARRIKQQMFGLEPPQIASLLQERTAVLESVREGIIAIDEAGLVTVANQEALRLLQLPEAPIGRPILEVVPQSRMLEVLQTGEAQYAQEMILGGRVVVANRIPVRSGGRVVGVVSSFRDRTELDQLTSELTAVRRYSEALRAQAHEFNNRLHAVAGLVQLGAHEEALEYILRTHVQHQELLDLLARAVPDPLVAAIILGKYNRAAELKVRLELDPASRFTRAPAQLGSDLLVTVLGNLTDNAIEAVQGLPEEQRWVRILLDDGGPSVRLVVTDGGPGIPPELVGRVFTDGFSTKQEGHRGFGLALVHLLVTQAGGQIEVARGPSRFVITFVGRNAA